MKPVLSFAACAAFVVALLPAQTPDTVGGTNSSPTRSNSAKANLFQVDASVLLFEIEMFLDVPGAENLTWFVYRHHSRSGDADLVFQTTTAVTGGGGAAFYSSGQILVPMLCGNHYLIGCSWAGSVTYHYNIGSPGDAVSFGNWQRGRTPTNPLPASIAIGGNDAAQYYQRITTLQLPSATCGPAAACAGQTTNPRLVAAGLPTLGRSFDLDLVEASPSSFAIFAIADGPPVAAPTALRGCSVWIDLNAPLSVWSGTISASGEGTRTFSVPSDPNLAGLQVSVQAGVLGGGNVDMTNVIGLAVN